MNNLVETWYVQVTISYGGVPLSSGGKDGNDGEKHGRHLPRGSVLMFPCFSFGQVSASFGASFSHLRSEGVGPGEP